MFKKSYLLVLSIITILGTACDSPTENSLTTGLWKGEIALQNNILPFNFELLKQDNKYKIDLINGSETLELDEVIIVGDSLFVTMHIFDIEIRAKIGKDKLEGHYIKNYIKDYKLPFIATYSSNLEKTSVSSSDFFNGKWDMTFTGAEGNTSKGVGSFNNRENAFKGTILTPLGDYRYLTGTNSDKEFTLHTFDGNHAFVFKATKVNDTLIEGDFWSGKSFHEEFTAIRNENAALPDANSLTYLKDGYDRFEFSFPDLNGNQITLSDPKYRDKVVLVQIFGTWCPNCMDETIFYADWYRKNKHRGVEIIGLAYEAKPDFNYAKSRVEKMISRLNVDYDFLIAGTYDKEAAAKTLPMLNHVLSFPTTVYINKKGAVSKIHTGFSGPATGEYYTAFKKEFEEYMDFLLSESSTE